MFKYLLIASVLIVSVLSSCSKYQAKMQKKWCNVSVHDSTYTEVTHILDTTFVQIPFSELTFDTTDTRLPYDLTIEHKENKGSLNAFFSIKHQKIKFECNVQPYIDTVAFLRDQISNYHLKVETKLIPCDRKHKTSYDYACEWIAPILLAFILIYIVIKAFK